MGNLKNLKNQTVKVCKICCNDVYMYILYCDILWWKVIDRNFLNHIFNTGMVSQGIHPFSYFNCFAHEYVQTGYSYMPDISYLFNNITLKCIRAKIFPFKQKEMCISIRSFRNKNCHLASRILLKLL